MSTISTFGTCQICGLIQPKQGQCRDCNGIVKSGGIADPVPPAGVDVEAVIRQYRVVRPDPRDTPYSAWFEIESAEKDDQISASLRFTEGRGEPAAYEVRELVEREHVTRLQAEVEQWRASNKANALAAGELVKGLQSELTKARELLADVAKTPWIYDVLGSVREYLSNQSAPADKTGQTCVVRRYERDVTGHSDVEVHASGLVHYDHGPNLAEALARLAGRVARFHKLEAPSLAEQPAPVAVVMPERMPVPVYQIAPLAAESAIGWNNCLKEVVRLNPGRPEKSAPVQVLAEAREWLGDGKHADGLAREHWTPEYAALIDRIDATLSK